MRTKYFTLIIISMLFSNIGLGGRLDPHGPNNTNFYSLSISKRPNCKVCHKLSKRKKIVTLKNINKRCITCHNKLPHSGLAEHLGKDLSSLNIGLKGKMKCIHCHRPHRSKLMKKFVKKAEYHRNEPSFVLQRRRTVKLPKDMVENRTPNPMLKRTCIQCHTMDNLL